MRKGWVLLALIGLMTARPAAAAPNVLGSTGLLLIPSADVIGLREWNALAWATDDLFTFGANLGLFQNFEIGVTGFDADVPGADTEALINLKYRFMPESAKLPAVAIGVVDIADELDVDPSIYLVVSKALGSLGGEGGGLALRGHAGIGDGIYDTFFAGVDLIINPRVLAMLEYDSDDFNIGVRLGLTPEVRVDLALLDGDFGAGISFNAAF